ncbi:hypothetical protein [Streptomyces sp. enrichment culture]
MPLTAQERRSSAIPTWLNAAKDQAAGIASYSDMVFGLFSLLG